MFTDDLIDAHARYHIKCWESFKKLPTGRRIGRPEDENVTVAMENIYAHFESNEDNMFSIKELKEICQRDPPCDRTIKAKLKEKYGSRLIFAEKADFLQFSASLIHIRNFTQILVQKQKTK